MTLGTRRYGVIDGDGKLTALRYDSRLRDGMTPLADIRAA